MNRPDEIQIVVTRNFIQDLNDENRLLLLFSCFIDKWYFYQIEWSFNFSCLISFPAFQPYLSILKTYQEDVSEIKLANIATDNWNGFFCHLCTEASLLVHYFNFEIDWQLVNIRTFAHRPWVRPCYFFAFLCFLEIESFSNVVSINPLKSPKAEAIPNITTKLKPATIVTIQVLVPILSGIANSGLGIQNLITHKSTLESFVKKT